jgi:hypothetical protein
MSRYGVYPFEFVGPEFLSSKLAYMEVFEGRPWVGILQSLEQVGVHLGLDNIKESR